VIFMILLWGFSIIGIMIDTSSIEAYVLLVIVSIAIFVIVRTVIYRVPAAQVSVLESLIIGRFNVEKDEFNCSVPLKRPATEGLSIKWPWHKIYLLKRDVMTLRIENQRYDVKRGAVVVSGNVQFRRSDFCAYRALAISLKEVEIGMSAITDQVLVRKLIASKLEQALMLKADINESIAMAFKEPQKVTNRAGAVVDRILWEKKVSVSDHRYGVEITAVNIDRIDPIEAIAAARADVLVEELKKEKAKMKMKRFDEISKKFKLMYPELGQEKQSQLLKLTEGLSTEEKKVFGLADLSEIKTLVEQLIPAIRGVRGGSQ